MTIEGMDPMYVVEVEILEPTPEKCEHGVRIAAGDSRAVYCSGCNPGYARIMAPARRAPELHQRERTVDAAEYLDAPVWERLADADRMEAMC